MHATRRKAASQALGREKPLREQRGEANLLLILIDRIATVRVVIARNATVQMEEADCRWNAHSNQLGGASERSKRINNGVADAENSLECLNNAWIVVGIQMKMADFHLTRVKPEF